MTIKQRVLIIDDNDMALHLAARLFRKAGYEVYVAGNGAEGLAKVKNVKPNLVLLELMLPDMSGLEVCRQLRAHPITTRIPVIILSTEEQVDDKFNGLQADAVDYVQKPVSPGELLVRAGQLLQPAPRSHAPKT